MSQTFRERRGAHRPPGLGPAGSVPWLIAAVAIVAIVAYASGWFSGSGAAPGSSTVSAGPSSSTTRASGPSRPAPSSSAGGASASPSATVDRARPVSVLNGTRTSGLAARGAAKLRAAGWTIHATGNFQGGAAVTTVYYGRADLQPTAQAVATALGVGAVKESADFGGSRVTVVLGPDFQP